MTQPQILSVAICLLFQMRSTNAAEVEKRQVVFTSKAESLLYEETPISVKKSESLISCSHYCTRDKRCKSANFIKGDGVCSLLNKTRITHPKSFLREQVGAIHLEKVNADLGSSQELAVSSCRSLSSSIHPSGVYWVDPDGGSQINAFKVYCDMETDGGGWTLVWSYSFTDYKNFASVTNAVSPRPNWPGNLPYADIAVSTAPPLNEHDYNAFEFSKWKKFGRDFFIKSNINNWIVCSPDGGSLVDWQKGSVDCKIAKHVSEMPCLDGSPPVYFNKPTSNGCGPWLKTPGFERNYYYFDSCTGKSSPGHNPCAEKGDKSLRNVANPHGNIYIR